MPSFSPFAHGWTIACLWPPTSDGHPSAQVVALRGKCTALTPAGDNEIAHHFVAASNRVDPKALLRAGQNDVLGGPTLEPFKSGSHFPDKSQRGVADPSPSKDWWTLYTCSLDASLSMAVSTEGLIECAIGSGLLAAFEKNRLDHPPAGLGWALTRHNILYHMYELVWRCASFSHENGLALIFLQSHRSCPRLQRNQKAQNRYLAHE